MRRFLALCLVAASCSGGTAPTTSESSIRAAALDYAASADRALDGTVFSEVTVGGVADTILRLCENSVGLTEAVAATSEGAATAGIEDTEILAEVLVEGMRQVCPERAGPAALLDAFVAAVGDAVASVAPGTPIDRSAVLSAGSVACDLLDRRQGPESALLAIAAGMFGVEAGSMEELGSRLGSTEGVVAGATLAAAARYLCPSHDSEVARFLEALGS